MKDEKKTIKLDVPSIVADRAAMLAESHGITTEEFLKMLIASTMAVMVWSPNAKINSK